MKLIYIFYNIAKNVILTGVKSVTLHDNNMVSNLDLASNVCVLVYFFKTSVGLSNNFLLVLCFSRRC